MLNDLELINSFNKIWELPVYLWGAGKYSDYVISTLKDLDISINGIIDNNTLLCGTKKNGITIYKFEQVRKYIESKSCIIIITTLSHSYNVIEQIKQINNYIYINCNIYTLYAYFWGLYFNLNLFPQKNGIREKYLNLFTVWKYSKICDIYSNQSRSATNAILSLLNKKNSDIPILIYQPGKVGSNTIEFTLKEYNVDVIRSHGVLYPYEFEKTNFPELFYNKVKKFKKIKLITLVRDPIAKDIGHFFQKCHVSGNDVAWIVKGIMEKDFQQSFFNYLSVVTPLNFLGKNKDVSNFKIVSHIDYIGQKNKNGALWGWYEEELKEKLGIDILNYPFNVEKGYSIIQKDNMEILVIKLECLNNLETVLADFVGIPELHLVNSNEAKNKSYYYTYKQFKE